MVERCFNWEKKDVFCCHCEYHGSNENKSLLFGIYSLLFDLKKVFCLENTKYNILQHILTCYESFYSFLFFQYNGFVLVVKWI